MSCTESPKIQTVDFTIVDRLSDGTPMELRVGTLRGLLRLRDFVPEDHALGALKAQR